MFLTRHCEDLAVFRKLIVTVDDAQIFRILHAGTGDVNAAGAVEPSTHIDASRVRDCQSLRLMDRHSPCLSQRHVLNPARRFFINNGSPHAIDNLGARLAVLP